MKFNGVSRFNLGPRQDTEIANEIKILPLGSMIAKSSVGPIGLHMISQAIQRATTR